MAKEELLEFDGDITEAPPDGSYRVNLEYGHEILAYAGGKMRKHRINNLAGDRVTVEMSAYDLTKGRITFRHKPEGTSAASPKKRTVYRPRGRR